MVLSPTQKTKTAFEIAKDLPAAQLAEVSRNDNMHKLEKVAEVLAETHTPAWLFYYLSEEASGEENVSQYLVSMVSSSTIEEELDNRLDEGEAINLRNPASHNWMSEDPMEPFREEYNEKKTELQGDLRESIRDVLDPVSDTDEISEEDLDDFSDSYSEQIAEAANYVRVCYLQQNGYDPADVILGDTMRLSLLDDLFEYHGFSTEETHELTSDLLNDIKLPSRKNVV